MRHLAHQSGPILLAVLATVGCGRVERLPTSAVKPTTGMATLPLDRSASELRASGAANFYPLEVGNRWRYVGVFSKAIISSGGRVEKHGSWKREAVITRTD